MIRRNLFITLGLSLLVLSPVEGRRLDPASWELRAEEGSAPPGSEIQARLTVKLEPGWHLYSPTTPAGGPIPTSISLAASPAIAGYEIYQQAPVRKLDPAFQIDTETFEKETTFLVRVRFAKNAPTGKTALIAKVRYQLCNDTQCLPPKKKTASATVRIDPGAHVGPLVLSAGYRLAIRREGSGAASPTPGETRAPPAAPAGDQTQQDPLRYLLVAFGFGIAGIFTPCVFPMIPIVLSQFLQQATGRRRGNVMQALVFCLGIIVLFSLLGIVATAALGPFGMVQLGSNPWVNTFIALVFFVFALSLLGAFELRIPSRLLTRLNAASDRGGYAGALLMGFTFSLAAFACVGPFVGTLLAASIQNGGLRPLLGMVAFATGLAGPFFLLALFPSYLRRLPRAGAWMIRVKVVFGFIILAAMFKYLSNVDQVMQWGLLTRERFLAIWIVLFAMVGLYLLGLLRLEGVDPNQKLGVPRLLIGIAFLVFAVSLIPGMLGRGLGELDAYIPLAENAPSAGGTAATHGPSWMKNQYREALAKARVEGKLVLVSFTGYACTNCHWMKTNMFRRPEIAAALGHFVLVELYTDGTDAASAQNQALQEKKFSTVAIPFYAILTPEEKVVASFPGLTRDTNKYLAFLQRTTAAKAGEAGR